MSKVKTTNTEQYSKEKVQEELGYAVAAIKAALLFPRGMSVVDFHDLTNMLKIIEEMIEGRKL